MGRIETLILAGGKGSRLWPLSRTRYPKPFVRIHDQETSLFQQTVERALLFSKPENIWIVVNEAHTPLVHRQLAEIRAEIPEDNILREPAQRDTLPAVLHALLKMGGNPTVALMPSDQYVKENDLLAEAIKSNIEIADKYILAIGVKPTEAYTGYGYIRPGERITTNVYRVLEFKEKPDPEKAREYVRNGYLWNTFIHVFKKSLMLEEIRKNAESVYLLFEKYNNDPSKIYPLLQPISISRDVLEKTNRNAVIPLEITWSDVGSFDLVYKLAEKDDQGNSSNTELVAVRARNNYVQAPHGKIVAIVGLNDIVVVDTPDALLVSKKSDVQDVKTIFRILEEREHKTTEHHRTIPAEWGNVDVLGETEEYAVVRLRILPGKIAVVKPMQDSELILLAGDARINGTMLKRGDIRKIWMKETTSIENIGESTAEILRIVQKTKKSTQNGTVKIIMKELEG